MYSFFDNVPSDPTAEILKIKLQSPSYLGAARGSATEIGLTYIRVVLTRLLEHQGEVTVKSLYGPATL